MAGVPRPGALANPNGFSVAGPLALPGGVVFGQDAPIIREFLAAVSLNGGEAVVYAPSLASLGYFVTKSSLAADQRLRVGIVTGARVGVSAASAASQPVWVVINGPAWGTAAVSTIAIGDLLTTASQTAGQIATASNGFRLINFGATVSLATSWASFTTNDIAMAVTGVLGTDVPVAWNATASMPGGLITGGVWSLGGVSVAVRIANPTATAVASQASLPGTLTVARPNLPIPGTVLGVALTAPTVSAGAFQVFVDPQ